jgi:dTDP-4-amino-4,6-dideoxygalactose transaminase
MSIRSSSTVPFAYPYLGREEEDAVIRVLRSGWLTTGKEALSFENEFAAFLDPDGNRLLRAYAVNSATSGLHLALEACGVGPGDVVLTCPYTFTATAEVIRYLGADVAFVDSEENAFNIDPAALERTVERLARGLPAYPARSSGDADGFGPRGRPAAVIPVHFAGLVCDMEAIGAVCRRFGARVVEDAAHAFPSSLGGGNWAGTVGDVGVFSFYATKTITTGEGGMVVTADPEMGKRIAVMRSHGIDRAVWDRYTDRRASWRYAVVEAGYKYNLPDVLAAIGREQLKRANDLLAMRRSLAEKYDAAFASDDRFIVPPTGPGDARHLYPLRLSAAESRDAVIESLQNAGVGVSVHFIPLHTMPYYAERYSLVPEDFPRALKSFSAEISLPLWPGMTEAQSDAVIAAVRAAACATASGGTRVR